MTQKCNEHKNSNKPPKPKRTNKAKQKMKNTKTKHKNKNNTQNKKQEAQTNKAPQDAGEYPQSYGPGATAARQDTGSANAGQASQTTARNAQRRSIHKQTTEGKREVEDTSGQMCTAQHKPRERKRDGERGREDKRKKAKKQKQQNNNNNNNKKRIKTTNQCHVPRPELRTLTSREGANKHRPPPKRKQKKNKRKNNRYHKGGNQKRSTLEGSPERPVGLGPLPGCPGRAAGASTTPHPRRDGSLTSRSQRNDRRTEGNEPRQCQFGRNSTQPHVGFPRM